ncbi:BrnA antitoxin family protein [Phenylobacterium sp.]|uniref:BrnA antitoxin family protein n=1 Tax=Phenylobacterium sp. TaxID=1871053 RepID=UPI0025DCCF41|nr:BrnA antitoxin family protein [Phenylobacterium sp.]MCA3722090.1 BrnA antitoxin family protein [Phenylobacterium sp.]
MPATDGASRPDADNPEWTEAMAAAAVRLEALPEGLQRKLRGRPRAAVTKQRTTLRLSREVLEQFRATGPGWQTRIDIALKDWLEGRGRLG